MTFIKEFTLKDLWRNNVEVSGIDVAVCVGRDGFVIATGPETRIGKPVIALGIIARDLSEV